jgi:membrane-bound lytic murein transglycosylase B
MHDHGAPQTLTDITRRVALRLTAAFLATLTGPANAAQKAKEKAKQGTRASFAQWVESFKPRALARGVSEATYTRVMRDLKPDTSVYALDRSQPEFTEKLWQYLNRRVSDWRITEGREKAKEYDALLKRIEQDFGVAPPVMLGIWGVESAYGDPYVQKNHMRPIFPALAALAWGEPRRRRYWEQELLNALVIVERGWGTPEEMRGSWAGAMGHTQWMPEVWLNMGMDYDRDGRVNPFGRPDDALASTARYLMNRGKYRRGEHWGYEVNVPKGAKSGNASRNYEAWRKAGFTRADGQPFPQPNATAKLWVPEPGGPGFLVGPNFYAVRSYNPSMNYTLAIVHLGDRIMGAPEVTPKFPGGERAPTLAEIQEIQRRLTALGFDTGGSDGRIGNATMRAIHDFQQKIKMEPADGYAGVRLLARLREAR